MIRKRYSVLVFVSLMFSHVSLLAADISVLEQQVKDTERAFAQTMADRDFEAFKSFLSDEAVFFAGGKPTRGSQAIADDWEGFFEEEQASFSWQPNRVAVLESGNLALSSGPVFNSDGEQTGFFNSVWRRNEAGQWKVIFDKGGQYCPSSDQNE